MLAPRRTTIGTDRIFCMDEPAPAWRPLSERLAFEDARLAARLGDDLFAAIPRALVRITAQPEASVDAVRAALALATRAFGSGVDYCLCTPNGLSAGSARRMLSGAACPVEWRAGPSPRIRPGAPELAMDSSLLALRAPSWFDAWRRGAPVFRKLTPTDPDLSAWAVTFDPTSMPMPQAASEALRAMDAIADPAARSVHATRWLGGSGQWGVPGWSASEPFIHTVARLGLQRARLGGFALELGTSRGRVAATLGMLGCRTTTVDHADRGGARNLADLPVHVVRSDASTFLEATEDRFDLIVIDLHGNTPAVWSTLGRLLLQRLNADGALVLNNTRLDAMPEWRGESGVRGFIEGLGKDWRVAHSPGAPPGFAVVRQLPVGETDSETSR
jgi:hypothetical protein